MCNIVFTVKKILLNITRNKGRSLILAVYSFLTVFFVGIYFGNLEQNQQLLTELGAKIPVTASISNSTGDRLTGLDITEKRIELFMELGLKECAVTAESYGNIGVAPENTEERASVHLTGTNTVSSMDAWKPKFSQEREQVEELLSGEKGLCLLNENYVQERGMSYQAGDVLDIHLYRALYDDFDGVTGFVEITSSELEIAGFYQTAQESALEAADIVCPVSWLARQYEEAGEKLLYSSAKGIVENPLEINRLKSKAEEARFLQTDIQSVGGRSGNALVIDDRFFIQSASQLKNSIHLLNLFRMPLLLLVIGISALVCFFAMCSRKQEIYLERCMGRKRTQIAAELAGEYGVLSLLGGASALQITEGNRGLFILALFLGIQIVTSIAAAIWLSLGNPMKIFSRME